MRPKTVATAVLLAFGVARAGAALARLQQVARHARIATGVVMAGVGVFLSLTHVFHVW
jgi:hypothetical protein